MNSPQQVSSPGAARPTRPKYRKEMARKELIAYQADLVRVERTSDSKTFIVTLTTPDGFEVSFLMTGQQLNPLGEANTSWADADFVSD